MMAPAGTTDESEIEFWFEFASNYSYLSVMRIEDAARRCGVRIALETVFVRPHLPRLGLRNIAFRAAKGKGCVCVAGHGAPVPQVRAALGAAHARFRGLEFFRRE